MDLVRCVIEEVRKASPKITAIGETLHDEWVFGRCMRMNPEAPDHPIFVEEHSRKTPGGCASMVESLTTILGERPRFLTVPAAVKRRYALAVTGQILFRADYDEIVDPITEQALLGDAITKKVIVSDYGKGLVQGQDTINKLEGILWRGNHSVVYSPHISTCHALRETKNTTHLREDWVWVMNNAEAKALAEGDIYPHEAVVTYGRRFMWCMTVELRHKKEVVQTFKVPPLTTFQPAHTSAIGDVFLAAFSAARFAEFNGIDCINFAIQCCHLVLTGGRIGTHYLTKDDLMRIGIHDGQQ